MSSEDTERRRWRCPNCGNEQRRYWNEVDRPFCDPCDSREAVLIEMKPIGPGKEEFYDEDGNAINRSLHTDTERDGGDS